MENKNPRKRPLLSSSSSSSKSKSSSSLSSNKYSSSSKNKLSKSSRPPQKASVARLESLIDGKNKKKKKKIAAVAAGTTKNLKNSSKIIHNDKEKRKSIQTRNGTINSNTENNKNGTSNIVDNANTTATRTKTNGNELSLSRDINNNNIDRWSYVNNANGNVNNGNVSNHLHRSSLDFVERGTKKNIIGTNYKFSSEDGDLSKNKTSTKDRKRKKIDAETFHVEKEEKRNGIRRINNRNSTSAIANNFPIRNIPILPGSSSLSKIKDDTTNLPPKSSSSIQQDDRSSSTTKAAPVAMGMEIGGEVVIMVPSVSSASSNILSDKATTTSSSFRPKLGLQLSSSNKITNKMSNNKRRSSLSSSSGRMMTSFSSMTSSSSSLISPSSLITQSSSLSSSATVAVAAVDAFISKEEEQQQSIVLPSPSKKFDNKSSLLSQNNDEKNTKTTTTTTRVNNNNNVSSSRIKKGKKNNGNDNFVRQNLKNNAGACRGAKNKSSKFSKERRSWSHRGGGESYSNNTIGDDSNYHGSSSNNTPGNLHAPGLTFDTPAPSKYSQHSSSLSTSHHDNDDGRGNGTNRRNYNGRRSNRNNGNVASYVSKMSGLDPLDEFVDGTFHSKKKSDTTGSKKNGPSATTKTTTTTSSSKASMTIEPAAAPMCARHQRPCKLIKVKKNTTGNKGRMFYACHMPRGEQCDHFQWADDTIEAARETISKNTSFSSFIARQVAAHVDRFRTLTVPELKDETARRGLNKNGKKQQLLMRLAIWTRDELVKGYPEECAKEKMDGDEEENAKRVDAGNMKALCASDEEDSDGNSSTSSEDSSDDELELFDGDKESDVEDDDDDNETAGYTLKEATCSNQQLAVTIDKSGEGKSLSESLQDIFGHDSFRNGQEWAIQRCLEQKRSLLVAPTGFGKSLCYALPAALMEGVCVVVSPLISLIQDQLRSLPPRIPAATLSGSISASKTAAILDDIVRKRLKILFVSPERLTSPAFRRLFNLTWNPETKTKERKFPEISLLCIDEAHCISQWAHNFRPCFLRFKGFLKIMKPKSILAITATAGPRVIADIGQTLDIKLSESESVSKDSPEKLMEMQHESIKIIRTGRDNIDVMCKFMSNHEERLAVLSGILTRSISKKHDKKRPYAGKLSKGSVIVYVWRQKDTEAVAESIVAAGVSGGVVVYHGGMDATARAKSQSRFMRGKARIVVATVAFGLGIDKADIIGVIHLYLSNSPEHYLQEIGRAGRDGRPATAIALPLLEEVPTRHSLVHSNLVAKSQIRSLFKTIRRLVKTARNVPDLKNYDSDRILHVALPVHSTVRGCDCKPETIETFLSLIERIGGDNPLLQIEGYNYDGATIALKKRTLQKLAEREPIAVSIQAVSQCIDAPLSETGVETKEVQTTTIPSAFQRQFLAYSKGSHSFSIWDCANRLGPTAEPRHVFAALRRLQSSNELEFVLDTSERGRIIHLKISGIGLAVFDRDDYDKFEEDLVNAIFESFSSSGNSGANKVLDMHFILDQVANSSDLATNDDDDEEPSSSKSQSLMRFQELSSNYFGEGLETERLSVASELLPKSFFEIREKELKIDAMSLLRDLPSLFQNDSDASKNNTSEQLVLGDPLLHDYTALALTKFLHGHDTPRTPMFTFRQYPLFGKWKTVDFRLVHKEISKLFQ